MEIKQLLYFLTIAEEGNITKAAGKLNMAQPPLSKQLKILENELGIKLIERNTRSISITEAGKRLQYRAKQIIELTDTTIKELKDFGEGIQGTLRIGTLRSIGNTVLPIQIFNFHEKYPNINFQIKECNSIEIIDLLKNGLIDIGIVRSPIELNDYSFKSLPMSPMVAVTSNSAFWNNTQNKICMNELNNSPILIISRCEKIISQACKKYGFEPNIIGKSDDAKAILQWANMGMGIAILPKDVIEWMNDTNLKFKELDEPCLNSQVVIIWRKNNYLTSASQNFLAMFNLKHHAQK